MTQIRRKTAYDRRAALSDAREKGIALSWNRYENMLPQDGFARLGLACFDCLLGPCRISPFTRGQERTVCGFMPDDLVYRALMRLLDMPVSDGDHYSSLIAAAKAALGPRLSMARGEVFRIGPGVLVKDKANVCMDIYNPEQLVKLREAGCNAVTVGMLAAGCDCASSLGDAEFLLLTGLVDAYVTSSRGVALLRGAAAGLNTAILGGADTDAVIAAAETARAKRGEVRPDSFVASIDAVPMKQALQKAGSGAVVIGGDSNLKLTLDELALTAAGAFGKAGRPVIVCGGAAVSLAKYALENVIWCCEEAVALLDCGVVEKPPVLLPEISARRGLAEALALGAAGFTVVTATELPLGNGALGERIGALVRCVKAQDYMDAVKEVCAHAD